MRFFIDTEFIERGPQHPVTLISLGIVTETCQSFYVVSSEFREEDCSDWVKQNVLPALENSSQTRLSRRQIAILVRSWVCSHSHDDSKPEFWGYYCDYDWVVFAQLFGTMMDLPQGWPMYCRDLKQWADQIAEKATGQAGAKLVLPAQESTEHNALADAKWNLKVWKFLNEAEKASADKEQYDN